MSPPSNINFVPSFFSLDALLLYSYNVTQGEKVNDREIELLKHKKLVFIKFLNKNKKLRLLKTPGHHWVSYNCLVGKQDILNYRGKSIMLGSPCPRWGFLSGQTLSVFMTHKISRDITVS